jgi:hypothetical protein
MPLAGALAAFVPDRGYGAMPHRSTDRPGRTQQICLRQNRISLGERDFPRAGIRVASWWDVPQSADPEVQVMSNAAALVPFQLVEKIQQWLTAFSPVAPVRLALSVQREDLGMCAWIDRTGCTAALSFTGHFVPVGAPPIRLRLIRNDRHDFAFARLPVLKGRFEVAVHAGPNLVALLTTDFDPDRA